MKEEVDAVRWTGAVKAVVSAGHLNRHRVVIWERDYA